MPGIAHRRLSLVLGAGIEPEFGHAALAEGDKALRQQLLGERAVALGGTGIDGRRSLVGRQPLEVGVVLDEGRHAGKKSLPADRPAQGLLEQWQFHRIDQGLHATRAGNRGLRRLAGADVAAPDLCRQGRRIQIGQRVIGKGMCGSGSHHGHSGTLVQF